MAQKTQKYSLEDASEYVRNKHEGKILSAKTNNVDGKTVHRIQILTKTGRVKVYRVNENVLSNTKPTNQRDVKNKRRANTETQSNRTNIHNRMAKPKRRSNNRSSNNMTTRNRTSVTTKNSANGSKNK